MASSLHSHSEYSLLDGYSSPEDYLKKADEIGLKAFAITEHGNQYSWIYFDKLKEKYPNVKMIYGVEMYECFNMKEKDKNNKYFHLIVLARNENGRKAINEIITQSEFEGFYYKPRISIDRIAPYGEDLIVSSACLASKLARECDYNKCLEYIKEYKAIFPYFYLEMQSHNALDQEEYNKKILKLSKDTNTPYIITTDSHAATKEDLKYQGRLVQIAHDTDTASEIYEDCYLQTEDEIHNIMDKQIGSIAVNIGLQNTDKIADLIEDVNMPFQEPQLPKFPLPKEFKTDNEYLLYLIEQGWKEREINELSNEEIKIRKERVKYEMEIIHQMDYDGYFLIVWDFINFARRKGIAIGAGRGSGAGSIVCYLIGITDIDPIKYGLIFERFLNPERISLPDLDIDVGDREIVINYLIDKYGEKKVCQIINFSYITPTVAIRDVGRILKIPYKIIDSIAQKFSFDTFEECMENNPTIEQEYPDFKELFDIASHLSGKVRHVSIHAAGVGIVNTKITDYMAMKLGSKNEHVIQVDKKIIESIGIVKFDVLGVATLNLIQQVVKDAGITLDDININNPKFENDEEAFNLLCQANTQGVFQVASAGMKDLLVRLQPRNLEELSALIALYRPDSMGFIDDYINNKHNPKNIKYIHNDMKQILENTYNCMIYQEQLLDIVRRFGGRTYGMADKFRKAIGKKEKQVVIEEATKLKNEIIDNGYLKELAITISEELKTKGGYLFNKSHSTAYAVLCLQTAYLKSHYPVYFYNSMLNLKKGDNGEINKFIVDGSKMGIKVLPPHINKSDELFTVHDDKILFGLSAINSIGDKVVINLLEERKNGQFKGFMDLINRVNLNESQIVNLIKSGAIPTKNKKSFLINYAKYKIKEKQFKEVKTLPTKLELQTKWDIDTNIYKTKEEKLEIYNLKKKEKFDKEEKERVCKALNKFKEKHMKNEKMWEFEALSIFISNNPFEKIYKYLIPVDEIQNEDSGVLVGVISDIQKKKDKNKRQYAFIHVYSAFGVEECMCWANQYKIYQDLIKKGNIISVKYKKKEDKLFVAEIKTFEQWKSDVDLQELS